MPKDKDDWEILEAMDEAGDPIPDMALMLKRDKERKIVRVRTLGGTIEAVMAYDDFGALIESMGTDCPACKVGQLDDLIFNLAGLLYLKCFECDARFDVKNNELSRIQEEGAC